MQDYSINTEFVLDWFLEPEEAENQPNKPSFNVISAIDNDVSLIDITPMDGGTTKRSVSPKKDYNQFNNTKTAEFNSPVKTFGEAKSIANNSVLKRRTQSFSESGSSDSSDDEGTLRMKANDDEIKKCKNNYKILAFSSAGDKKDDSRFNIIKSSSEEGSKKNQGQVLHNNFNIDDEIQFKYNNKDHTDSGSGKKNDIINEDDIILNIKKK
jgi:hypothetical protein